MADLKLFHVQLTIFCSSCHIWSYLDSKSARYAVIEAKEKGWKLKNNKEWLCPRCNGSNPNYVGITG